MKKSEFIQRFQLNKLHMTNAQEHLLSDRNTFKPASVAICLFEKQDRLHVLLTKRAAHLRHHAGQISFPGGKQEPFDETPTDAAIREAKEETGIVISKDSIIGHLAPYRTISGFKVTPCVALIDEPKTFQIDTNEVAEVFDVPLRHFLERSTHITIDVPHRKGKHQVHFMPYQRHNIWGATAAMLHDLANLICPLEQ